MALLLAVQLVPLPPAWWHGLPERLWSLAVLDEAGIANAWRPPSLTPDRTIRAVLASIVPAALLFGTMRLDRDGRALLWRIVPAGALLGALLTAI